MIVPPWASTMLLQIARTEPRPRRSTSGPLNAEEAVEESLQIIFVNAGGRVFYFDLDPVFEEGLPDNDLPSGVRILSTSCRGDSRRAGGGAAGRRRPRRRGLRQNRAGHRDALVRKLRAERFEGVVEYVGRIDVLFAVGQGTEVREGELKEIVNQAVEPKYLPMERADGVRRCVADTLHKPSISPRRTAKGVRSSWEMSATHWRRALSLLSRVSAITLSVQTAQLTEEETGTRTV